MKRRAEAEQRTRLRITESTVELHGTLGPSRTSVSAVARRAGVRRSTVYRHFPDEASLFFACTSYWTAANPVPDISRWLAIDDPAVRLTAALRELYAHYRRTERMMSNILRDEATMPIVRRMLRGYRDYLTAARETLMSGRDLRGPARQRVQAAVGHALTFGTWRSLAREQGLTDPQAAGLMCRLITAAANG
jgi:AcrR family transcriptional regulator